MLTTNQFSAHELMIVNEALLTKVANIEVLSSLSTQAQDPQLQNILVQHAQWIQQHYQQGVNLVQSLQIPTTALDGALPVLQQGVRDVAPTTPNPYAQAPSDRAISMVVLNLHKYGAIGWTTFALECINPQLRTFFMNGASLNDRMAYDVWNFMSQRGYYQIPIPQTSIAAVTQAYPQMPVQGPVSYQ